MATRGGSGHTWTFVGANDVGLVEDTGLRHVVHVVGPGMNVDVFRRVGGLSFDLVVTHQGRVLGEAVREISRGTGSACASRFLVRLQFGGTSRSPPPSCLASFLASTPAPTHRQPSTFS